MKLNEFCKSIGRLELSNAQKAVAILWFLDQQEPGIQKTSAELAKVIRSSHIGNPNSSILNRQIRSSGYVYTEAGLFRVREDKKGDVRDLLGDITISVPEVLPIEVQFLPEQIYKSTRGYINRVGLQLNSSYIHANYDCAAVMIRRLIETLIIEAYEKEKRQDEIKDGSNNFFMLRDLIAKATDENGLSLGRDVKKALQDIKKAGDRSAHNRRYNAKKSDLDGIKDGLRLCVEELMNIADLYSKG